MPDRQTKTRKEPGARRDAAELKRARESILQRETQFRLLAENLEEVIWLGEVGEDGGWSLVYISPAVEKFFGVTSEQIYASNEIWSLVVHEDDREWVQRTMDDFAKTLAEYDVEYRIRLGDGSIRWIWGRGNTTSSGKNTYRYTVEISQDVTDRKEAEQRAARRTHTLNAVVGVFQKTFDCTSEEQLARTCLGILEELTASRFGFLGEINLSGSFDTIALSDQGWEVCGEYVDHAPATDLLHRVQWRQLLDGASKRKFDLLLVWRMDRAFRSVLDAATTLERLRGWGVGLRSYSEPWLDTTSPFGEALYYITVAYAQLERGILRERVRAGMERARKQGHRIGRPRVTDRRGFERRFGAILERLTHGAVSRRQAARELGIGYATLKRLLDARGKTG